MKHPSNVSTCGIYKANSCEVPIPGGIIFENNLWLVRHLSLGRGTERFGGMWFIKKAIGNHSKKNESPCIKLKGIIKL
jgi:hypothetical protein